MNPVIEQMLAHRSIRKFTDEPVHEADITAAIEAGQMASTSGGIQSYSVLRIREPDTLDQLVELSGGQTKVRRCGAFFVICGDTRRHRLLAAQRDEGYDTRLEAFLLATVDASLFAQNMALAFESMGYGICYIGGLRNDLPGVQRALGCPEGIYPLFGMCTGRAADEPISRPRIAPDGVLLEERYPDDRTMLDELEAFDAVMLQYYRERGAGDRIWSQEMVEKFATPRRTNLASYYRSQGANLE
jgi:FMN reductase (NADPH)